jgi:hypothetical protein
LYQGTTLVGPLMSSKNLGFSPWAFAFLCGANFSRSLFSPYVSDR